MCRKRNNMDKLNILKQTFRVLFTISIITVLVEHGEAEMFNERCNEENNTTWMCNYVPKVVPEKYVHIRIVDFKRKDKHLRINSSSFANESWSNVKTLEFTDTTGKDLLCSFSHECFKGLNTLKELRIHVSSFWFNPGVFVGLPLVHTLDLSRCYRLVVEDVTEQLKVPNTLPNLQKLYLSGVGSYDKRNNINLTFVEALLPRNVTLLDVSQTQISFFDFTAIFKSLKNLVYLNVSYSTIANTWTTNIIHEDMLHIKVVDISHATLPANVIQPFPGKFVIENLTTKYSDVRNLDEVNTFFTLSVINASAILPEAAQYWIYNCTLTLDQQIHWKVKKLILRTNNIKYLDTVLICPQFKVTSLVHLDLSNNGLEMLHPTTCVPNLEIVDLSKNNLFMMLERELDLFEELFQAHIKLRIINLSYNQIQKVPPKLFKNNKYIEIIDLSFNNLEQLHLDLANLHRLRVFDISNNNIKILDEVSINNLNGIPCVKTLMSGGTQCSVIFTSNPIRCSSCDCKDFINWIVHSKKVNVKAQDLTCTSEDGRNIKLDEAVVRNIQQICNRRTIINASIVATAVTLLTIAMVVSFLYRRKRRIQRKQNRENVINKLIEGEGQHEFVAFLSYSSRDDQFVQENVIDLLNENLQLMTGIDRNLVCTGDQHLRPGFMVLDETINCLDRASVIIIVVSNNFCRSAYCQNEFDQAYVQRKPILLMFMEHVEENLMVPTMKQLYTRDVRILWTVENGQYVLKTTWENVCKSVLDKVQV